MTDLELDVTGVAHGGVFIARHEGRVVFVADAIPGERVLARVTDDSKRSFWRAETVRVLGPSEHRREHVWAEASVARDPEERPGGAEFGHIDLAFQRELKRQVVVDALARIGGYPRWSTAGAEGARDGDRFTIAPLPGDDERSGTGWRTRVTLHVAGDGTVGPYASRSHRVIPVSSLPLATDAVQQATPLGRRFPGARAVTVVAPSEGVPRVIVGDRPGKAAVAEVVRTRRFRLAESGFWQVHRLAAETLYDAVQQAIDGALFDPRAANLDLYGGVGLLAASVADRFGPATRITTVESDERATDFAAENLAEWVGAAAITSRVERFVRGLAANATAAERRRQRAATVVLDPPRSGAGKAVVAELLELAPAQLVYVACDPVAFARDAALFREGGYEIATLRGFDLFPNTHHVELVATLLPAP